MLTDEPAVRKALLRMVIRLEENVHAREDLLQEALVYVWSRERRFPEQQRSWYLQGVRFHL
jgi:DNA-directed RNA polymerase specialized sigma24 family protein